MADWVKLATDMFDNKKIKQIEVAPKGKQILLLWVRLICLAGTINDGGKVYVTDGVPYTLKGLAVELNENQNIVKNALELFERYNMIAYEEGCMFLPGWAEHQNIVGLEKIREQNRIRKQRQRERDKSNNPCDENNNGHDMSRDGHGEVTQQNKNKIENKNIENDNSLSNSLSFSITQLYEQKIGLLNSRIAEQLADLISEYGEARVEEGINIAHERGGRTLNYVCRCIENPIPTRKKQEEMPF